MSDKEGIDVSSEEILDEIEEQNKNNDQLFDTEKLEEVGEVDSSHVSSDELEVTENNVTPIPMKREISMEDQYINTEE